MKLLIINPGSTSTKLALYDGAEKLVQESLDHDAAELQQYHTIAEQVPMRLSVIRSFMERNGIDEKELAAVIGRGGMYAHLGVSDCRVIEQMINDGDEHAALILDAQAYQIAKTIGLLSIVLKGDCDAIILTGGLAYSELLTGKIKDYVGFIAPVCVLAGETEMEALALGGVRMLTGEEQPNVYHASDGKGKNK